MNVVDFLGIFDKKYSQKAYGYMSYVYKIF